MPGPFYTIGHSTRSIAKFVGLLAAVDVELVADVRAFPRSRANPQFNAEALVPALAAHGIAYEHIAALGGRRSKQRASGTANAFWTNHSFRNYADYAATDAFRAGLERLRTLGRGRCCAIMCAEAVWWRCHRRIIADYLIAQGETVFHIVTPGRVEAAKLTPAARRQAGGSLVYPEA